MRERNKEREKVRVKERAKRRKKYEALRLIEFKREQVIARV